MLAWLKSLGLYIVKIPGLFAAGYLHHISDIKTEWKAHWKAYVVQSIAATIVVFIIFFALTPERPVIVASIGASAGQWHRARYRPKRVFPKRCNSGNSQCIGPGTRAYSSVPALLRPDLIATLLLNSI